MTSYEIGSNSSRYPYDYSFVTDGTNGEYTDQTESSFILPTITAADANKFLEVNDTATGYQYTEIEGELPPQAGQTGKFLETNGTSVFWDTVNQVPDVTGGVSGYLLTNNGSSASWTNGPIGLGTTGTATPMLWFGATNNGFAEAWTAGGGATGISAITNGAVCCTFQSGAIRLPGGNPIRSNGNAAARFQFTQDVPNMQNSVTAGTVGTDRTVSVVSTNWASNSLDLVSSYTQDNPGNLVASSMAMEIKNTQILFTGAGTNTSGTTLPARQTRMTVDNSFITANTCLSVTSGLALTFSSQASNRTMTQNDNTFQRMNFSSNDVTYTLPVLNNGTMFYFNPFANAGSTFNAFLQGGTGGTGGVQNFETYFNGVRTLISNSGQTGNPSTPAKITLEAGSIYQCIYMASLGNWHIIRLGITQQVNFTGGSATVPSISFNDPPGVTGNTASGIYGADNSVSISTNGSERFTVTNNGVASQSRFIATRGLAITNGYSFYGTDIAGLYASASDNTMHLVSSTVPVLSVLNVGGAGGTGGTSTATVTGNLVVTGTISGSISTLTKKTVVIASNSSTAYVYDSGNTAPATTLISNSIQSQKNITLGNMGQIYDGFEFEFMLTGDLNNFGVAVTLSLANSIVKVRSGAIGIIGSTAGQVHTFSRPMNEFRITGVFVWNGGTPYWVVIDQGVYKQRATNDTFAGGTGTNAYKVTRSTPEDLLVTRDSDTTIDFSNLVTEGGSQEDYDGFNFWLSPAQSATGKLSFKNSLSVSIQIFTAGGVTTINAGATLDVYAAGTVGRCHRCIFRNNAGFKWFIYAM
jgi:hypothetical protein